MNAGEEYLYFKVRELLLTMKLQKDLINYFHLNSELFFE